MQKQKILFIFIIEITYIPRNNFVIFNFEQKSRLKHKLYFLATKYKHIKQRLSINYFL